MSTPTSLQADTLNIGIRTAMSTGAALGTAVDAVVSSGMLSRSTVQDGVYLFDYESAVCSLPEPERSRRAVSLTMPVGNVQLDAMTTVHPIFEMNLPEGALRERLMRSFAKSSPGFDNLSLLTIVGSSQLGRLVYRTQAPSAARQSHSIRSLLAYKGTEDLFADLLDRYATDSGISGIQPKVLVRDAAQDTPLDRVSHKGATHIIKSFDPREYPELAANEFFCMMAARLTGFPTAKVALAKTRRILAVERFDIEVDAAKTVQYLGFEDFCVLSGLRSDGRYSGSYEALAHSITLYTSGVHRTHALQQLFVSVALSHVMGNGDAHLKNFALLYGEDLRSIRLAPMYDMVCTLAYQPKDTLALTLRGSKAFAQRSELMAFGIGHCGLTTRRVNQLLNLVARATTTTIANMSRATQKEAALEPVCSKLADIFKVGLARSLI